MTARAQRPSTESPPLHYDSSIAVIQLSKDLYPTLVAALWELVRNSFIAGMPEGSNRWDAARAARVEIVVREERGINYCYLFDTGAGLTKYNRDRMTHAGGDEESTERAGGASKRQIGRLASLALNSAFDTKLSEVAGHEAVTYYSRTNEDIHFGYRAASLEISMRGIREGKAFTYTPDSVPLDDPRLGPFTGRKGSFTLLVIPNFKMTAEQIERELPYYLPRKADRQVHVSVNGNPLKGHIVNTRRGYISDNGEFEIYLDLKNPSSPIQHEAEGEIVICDDVSACAITTIRSSSTSVLQSYLRDDRLCGVVFYPHLFGQTNTGRTALNPLFWTTRDGRRFANYLNSSRTLSLVSGVLGSDVQPDSDAKTRELDAVLKQLENAFGPATDLAAKKKRKAAQDDKTRQGKDPAKRDDDPRDKPKDEPDDDPAEETSRKQRDPLLVLPIGDRQYVLLIEPNERGAQVARQPVDEPQRTVTIQGNTYSVISVNPDWKGSREVSMTQRTNFMVSEILRVAAEYAARLPRDRDEMRTKYYVDVCKGAWKSKQTQS